MRQMLGIAYRAIASRLIKAAGYHHTTGRTVAETLIHCFDSAFNVNIYSHVLSCDGVYVTKGCRPSLRRELPPP
jgi:hypothetical protein